MTVKFAHCFFEQSGTFRNEFHKLGIPAKDYDIANDFGTTDWRGDLFSQIESAYYGRISIFDRISPDDIIIAFYPCTYFCGNNTMFFDGTNIAWKGLTQVERLDKIIDRAYQRYSMYVRLLMLCAVVERRQLRMIVENPYNAHHYWRFNFPYKPAVIDMNRRLRGDYFPKPTQFLFVNCQPAGKSSVQLDKAAKFVCNVNKVERSMISPDYARNFICDHILGIESGHSVPTLFDITNS